MEKGFRRLLGTAVAGIVAGAMLAAPAGYADQGRRPVGAVQVCVQALSGGVSGSLDYLVRHAWTTKITVRVGACSPAFPVDVDEVAVYQQQRLDVAMRRISVAPPERLIEDESARRYVDVAPGPLGQPTVVTFDVVAAGR